MDLERFTQKAREALVEAQRRAQEHGPPSVEPAHLLLALSRQADGVVPAILMRLSGSPDFLIQEIEREIAGRPRGGGPAPPPGLSPALGRALEAAERQARSMKDEYVSTEHLLLGLAAGLEAD